jgi:4'-phosphopantetheinyl transferase
LLSPYDPAIEQLDLWHAGLDSNEWPDAGALPASERDRAARLPGDRARGRWVAARWALRGVLGHYTGQEPGEIELRFGERGKPMLADPDTPLRFNLSHSGDRALIAVAGEREVGVDVQLIGARHPPGYYREWTRREAVAKCHGVGLWAPLPDAPVAVEPLDAGAGFAAAVAIGGDAVPPPRHFVAEPG